MPASASRFSMHRNIVSLLSDCTARGVTALPNGNAHGKLRLVCTR